MNKYSIVALVEAAIIKAAERLKGDDPLFVRDGRMVIVPSVLSKIVLSYDDMDSLEIEGCHGFPELHYEKGLLKSYRGLDIIRTVDVDNGVVFVF